MSRLNFAIHIRLGDRKGVDQATVKYLELLETFMDTVSAAVVEQGYSAPLFHIFSETVAPCPWPSTNAFSEFPNWPVEPDQVRDNNKNGFILRTVCSKKSWTTCSLAIWRTPVVFPLVKIISIRCFG